MVHLHVCLCGVCMRALNHQEPLPLDEPSVGVPVIAAFYRRPDDPSGTRILGSVVPLRDAKGGLFTTGASNRSSLGGAAIDSPAKAAGACRINLQEVVKIGS